MAPVKTSEQPLVISASRRTDLVACYSDFLIEKLQEFPPEQVHTLVIWTKDPANMLAPGPLREVLAGYRQLFVHLTMTGLGGSVLEPRIPSWQQVAAQLSDLVAFVGDPRRITWRFDPIVRAVIEGQVMTNFDLFSQLAVQVAKSGITTCRTSWVEPYRKVMRRVEKKGIVLNTHAPEEREAQARRLQTIAADCGMQMIYCSMEGFERSSCIDGRLFNELHPDGLVCSVRRARGQRKLCGCTESRDIGWYSQKCPHGCLYCYAEPLVS
ncbi:MAG: DUF1848 domain-containing protein [Deltaproteobacteria bacterium]|nr:DUF1848 domain-containing protein [Deltaproteobacteria bacterium]